MINLRDFTERNVLKQSRGTLFVEFRPGPARLIPVAVRLNLVTKSNFPGKTHDDCQELPSFWRPFRVLSVSGVDAEQ